MTNEIKSIKPPANIIAIFNTTCNYRCRFCSHSIQGHKMDCWSWELITGGLRSLWEGSNINNIGGCGEISCLPFFERLLDFFENETKGYICFSTNGYLLDASKLRGRRVYEICVSTHTTDPETYDNLTGTKGRLPTVLDNIRTLATRSPENPRNFRLVVVAVVTEKNVLQAPDLARFCLDAGVDQLRFLSLADPTVVGLGTYPEDLVFHETEENMAALREACEIMSTEYSTAVNVLPDADRKEVVKKNMPECMSPIEQIVIGPEGRVQPCCFIPDWYDFGNVFNTPWEEIWRSEYYEKFRRDAAAGTCELCLKHCKNWG